MSGGAAVGAAHCWTVLPRVQAGVVHASIGSADIRSWLATSVAVALRPTATASRSFSDAKIGRVDGVGADET